MTVSAATFKVFNVMKQITHHINIILICLNVLGLTTFCHFQSENDFSLTFLFPFFFALLWPSSNPLILRSLFCIVALLSLVAVFIPYKFISILIASCSLGLALNIGYQLTNQIQQFHDQLAIRLYEAVINLSIALGILLSTLGQFMKFSGISAKLLVLTTTLANFYLPSIVESHRHRKTQKISNKACFSLIPFYMQTWTYSIGYTVGIYFSTFQIISPSKHVKYLIVSLLLLIEILTYRNAVKMISELFRAVLIYHFQKRTKFYELTFVLLFLTLRLFFSQNSLNLYLMLGYGAMAIALWRNQYRRSNYSQEHIQQAEKQTEIQLPLVSSPKKIGNNRRMREEEDSPSRTYPD